MNEQPNDRGAPATPWPEAWLGMLRARPARSPEAVVERIGPAGLRVTVPRRRPWYFRPPLTWILRPRLTQSVTLDEIGAQVWDLCDGERTVERVIDAFAETHRLTFHEARIAVGDYMLRLARRGALAMLGNE